ncbi:discoidin domain-containing protein [bacterium]|nr:discoidin domain-containing protein [bacterium]
MKPIQPLLAVALGSIIMISAGSSLAANAKGTATSPVKVEVDWPGFIERHDLIWDALPTSFDYGAFLGNGMLGSMIYQDGPNRLRWEMGRSDVTEHRRDNARLPIGGLALTTIGKIQKGAMRMDLWNAEVRGTITTDKGTITFRSFIHTDEMALITDVECTEGEEDASFAWDARPCIDNRNAKRFKDPPNPPASTDAIKGVSVCIQPRFAGGEFATAWKETPLGKGRQVIVSIADTFPGKTATQQAVATVEKIVNSDFKTLLNSHRDWWHDFYPKSMVSVPDPKLESFYWIQFYKLASASRPHRVPVDLLGPWYRKTGWPRIWWNLNIQTLYLPVYTGNRLELGESFTNFMDAKRANFYRNAKDIWGFDGCATVSHTTCYEGLRGDGSAAPRSYINPGDFTWALHNYYLQYRYSMDHSMVTDHSRHAFYPLLRDSVNLYLKLLKKGDDGKLHLPVLHSPEYGDDADNNYNLSLLRWGCQALIGLNQRYDLKDPLVPTWRQTLDDLVPYPVDANGLRIGATISYTKSHRHWSHILMVHPLHIMTGDQPENRQLLEKSVLHWLTVGGSRGINGWSRAAAASLYATLGDGENAIKQIHGHMADKRFVRPNTMYIEGSPVIECSIVLNRSLQDMLLQSWGNKIAVFPAIPKAWDRAVFHDLRAEGAFLVSAERKGGKTAWVRIKSLAGEPCRIQPGLSGKAAVLIDGKPNEIAPSADGIYTLPLAKGDEAILHPAGRVPDLIVRPLPADPMEINPFGSRRKVKLEPSLSSGRQATASSSWGAAYAPTKAFDNDPATRWAGAAGTRSGWLEVDLGEVKTVGRVVIAELEFPSTQEFTVECQINGAWREIARGAAIAGVKKFTFPPVQTQRVRLNLIKTQDDVPTIGEFQLFEK